MPSSTRTVRAGDLTVVVEEWGAEQEAAGSTVVLVHGIGVSHRYFAPLARTLASASASASVRVLAPDLPGFGRSELPARPFAVEDHARVLAVVLEQLGATASGPVVLLGHSMGCQVAVELAARRPDLVDRLLLVGPVAEPAARSAVRQAWRLLRDAPREPWSANSIMVSDWLRTGPRWYAGTLPTMLGYRLEDRLLEVAVPVLLVRGEHDPVCPPRYLTDLAERVRDASGAPVPVVEVPGEGHIAMYRHPALVAALCLPGRAVGEERPPTLAAQAASLVRHGLWWAWDYLYAGLAQLRGWRGRSEAGEYLDPPAPVSPDVVLVPGVYEPWTFMRPLAVLLHARGHRVHVLPELGYHRAPVSTGAAVLGEVLRARDLRDVVVVAHSKGGLVGKLAMLHEDPDARIARMVAVNTPFAGSVRARWFPGQTFRSFSPRDATVLALTAEHEVNARITSAYSRFDPHIPGGSELEGAANVRLRTPGHFRALADPELAEVVLATLAEVRGA
ncbi:alpha/beta hydrolase [Actinotalea sp. BY-33]|uniref:Alpha/beta hydrolase n=1 Tax=Actinotalea soli TaxID=2819234 RepID=A0A939LTC4_9CELL|nr:alpha/beta hydrolase [Actinotalea soli]MBO1752645.1 alpha/beta hydrolase [Actinotalea soli]